MEVNPPHVPKKRGVKSSQHFCVTRLRDVWKCKWAQPKWSLCRCEEALAAASLRGEKRVASLHCRSLCPFQAGEAKPAASFVNQVLVKTSFSCFNKKEHCMLTASSLCHHVAAKPYLLKRHAGNDVRSTNTHQRSDFYQLNQWDTINRRAESYVKLLHDKKYADFYPHQKVYCLQFNPKLGKSVSIYNHTDLKRM